jgi:inorganic pyrophosphatase
MNKSHECMIILPSKSKVEYTLFNNKVLFYKTIQKIEPPFNVCIFDKTKSISGNYLNGILLIREKIYVGTYINVKIIGAIKYTDSFNKLHEKLILIPSNENNITDIIDIENYILEEIKLFISNYNNIENNNRIKNLKILNNKDGYKIYINSKARFIAEL